MQELIKITDENGKKSVSARELHQFLESKQEFTNWIKNRIEKYDFIEGEEFEVFDNFIKNPNGGRPLIEYTLSIDCAKEIAMVEGNSKGKIARQYFIACEKKMNEIARPLTPAEMLLMQAQQLVSHERQIRELEQRQVETEAKVVEIVNHIKTRPDYFCVTAFCANHGIRVNKETAKSIGRKSASLCKQRGYEIGSVTDDKWGKVGSYPSDVLMEVFQAEGLLVKKLAFRLN